MKTMIWVGTWEETLYFLNKSDDRVVFYVPTYILRRLAIELGKRAITTFGTIVNSLNGHVYLLSARQNVVSVVSPDGVVDYAFDPKDY